MKRFLIAALLPLEVSCDPSAGSQAGARLDIAATAEARIRALWEHASNAVCTGNWTEYEQVWAHDSDIALIHPEAREWLVGWEAIGPKYEALLNSDFRCQVTTREMRVRVAPSGDMAWATVDAEFRVAGQSSVTGWQTAVFERRGDGWRLVHGHASLPPSR